MLGLILDRFVPLPMMPCRLLIPNGRGFVGMRSQIFPERPRPAPTHRQLREAARGQVMETPKVAEMRQVEEKEEEEVWEEAMETQLEAREKEAGTDLEGCTNDAGSRFEELFSQIKGSVNEVVSHVEGCLGETGSQFEECIEEVGRLERRRDALVAQLLQLEQPMAQAAQALRVELTEARRHLDRAELERRSLQEQVRQVKRRLFVAARDCIQSQVTLATQQHEVAQFTITQEELQAQIEELTQEAAQLPEAQQGQLRAARDRLLGGVAAGRLRRTRSDLTHCRSASADLQQRLRAGARALEQWYEPRLLALLRRRQWGEDALHRQREQTQDLRAQIGPLREETQALQLQRTCLEERIGLMEREREENTGQYRENLGTLEESLRDLRTEVQIQKKRNEEMETLKSRLSKELDIHRRFIEVYGTLRILSEKRPETGSSETLHR
ncbi:hypothetical protein AAFF_G00430140 [Aldrovandia affinis]|uniref:IF rod domain-containing protein n=1 Tax=Aldrovandia affinis TaxID=143900 RepID=A0AAD7S8Z5_9TELE|nr:hypothetical protein AAFF_G00430140 [Aldrovandia affinis]